MKLNQLVTEIKAGYTFRGKIQTVQDANIAIIQLKDIDYEFQQIDLPYVFLPRPNFNPNHFLQKGDILFIAKGARNMAVIYNNEGESIASSVFFIIKTDKNKLLPEYLAWYINSKKSQAYFERVKSGSSTLNINKQALEELEINTPSMEMQNKIANYCNLCRKEYILMSNILIKKKALNEQKMLNLLTSKK